MLAADRPPAGADDLDRATDAVTVGLQRLEATPDDIEHLVQFAFQGGAHGM
jgi:hypothetical protein